MKVVQMKCESRSSVGTSGARAARRAGKVPAVVYGEGRQPEHLALPGRPFRAAVDAGTRVIDIERDGHAAERVLLADVQWDAMGLEVIHADFLRMDPAHEIHLRVPITFEGAPKGLAEGGVLTIQRDVIEVRCLPKDIPEGLLVEVSALAVGDSIEAAAVALPAGVKLGQNPHDVIVTVVLPKVVVATPAPGEAAAAAEGAAPAAPGAAPAAGAAAGAAAATPAAGAKAPAEKKK